MTTDYEKAVLVIGEMRAARKRLKEVERELGELHRISSTAVLLAIQDQARAGNCARSKRTVNVIRLDGGLCDKDGKI